MNKNGTHLIGHCGVDSGQILLIDPCYVYEDDFALSQSPTGLPYDECCRITLSDDGAGQTSNSGVVTSTAWGDGNYPVYAEYKDGRIVSVTIKFDDTAQLIEEEDWDWEFSEDEDEDES
jgi:hypothetical protein